MNERELLPLETYATVVAHLLARGSTPVTAVLGRFQVSADDFRHAEEHWTDELSQALSRRKGMLAMTFAAAFGKARKEAGLLDASANEAPAAPAQPRAQELPSVLRDQAPPQARPHDMPSVLRDQAPPQPRPQELPSVLRDQAPGQAYSHDMPSVMRDQDPAQARPHDMPSVLRDQAASPPQAYASSAPPPQAFGPASVPPEPLAPGPSRLSKLQMTAPLGPIAPIALPFQRNAVPQAPQARTARPSDQPQPKERRSTGTIDESAARHDAPIPFTPSASSPEPALPMALEAYTALVVELTQKKLTDPSAIFARYGIANADEQRRIDAAMRALLDRDPTLRAKYYALVMHYSTAMRK